MNCQIGRRSRLIVLGVGVSTAGAALFASGLLVAHATQDAKPDQQSASTTGSQRSDVALGAPTDGAASTLTQAPSPGATGFGASQGGVPAQPAGMPPNIPYGGCAAALPDGVLSSGKLDPSAAGLSLPPLGPGFRLSGASIQDASGCRPVADGADPSLGSTWLHDGDGFSVSISESKAGQPIAGLLQEGSAQFDANGIEYHVAVGAPMPKSLPGYPAPAGAPGPDPRIQVLLEEVVGKLSPEGTTCLYRETTGGWELLSALGVGDPRPALPADAKEQSVRLTTYVSPPASCGNLTAPQGLQSLNVDYNVASLGGSLFINVSDVERPQGSPWPGPGNFNRNGASWTDGSRSFGVFLKAANATGEQDLIRAIAERLDPAFGRVCMLMQRELAPDDLAGLRLRAAEAPSGYSLQSSSLTATEPGPSCPSGTLGATYSLNWSFNGTGATINASESKGQAKGTGPGFISPNGLSWSDAHGVTYSVQAMPKSGSGTFDQQTLITVAKSMDPSLDLSSLSTTPGRPIAVPMPAPAPVIN